MECYACGKPKSGLTPKTQVYCDHCQGARRGTRFPPPHATDLQLLEQLALVLRRYNLVLAGAVQATVDRNRR